MQSDEDAALCLKCERSFTANAVAVLLPVDDSKQTKNTFIRSLPYNWITAFQVGTMVDHHIRAIRMVTLFLSSAGAVLFAVNSKDLDFIDYKIVGNIIPLVFFYHLPFQIPIFYKFSK